MEVESVMLFSRDAQMWGEVPSLWMRGKDLSGDGV